MARSSLRSRTRSSGTRIGGTDIFWPDYSNPAAYRARRQFRDSALRFAWALLIPLALFAQGAVAANPFTIWKDRLFGERPSNPGARESAEEGIVLLGLDRPEHIVIGSQAETRKFPKGPSRFREIELQREFAHVAVRVQVIAETNPKGRGNAVFKPILYVLDDEDKVRESTLAEPLEIDIRPFRPTRLLACVNLENVRRFAIATPASAKGKSYETKSRDKLKASSKSSFYYSTDAVKVNLPYIETGDMVIEVTRVSKKGDGC